MSDKEIKRPSVQGDSDKPKKHKGDTTQDTSGALKATSDQPEPVRATVRSPEPVRDDAPEDQPDDDIARKFGASAKLKQAPAPAAAAEPADGRKRKSRDAGDASERSKKPKAPRPPPPPTGPMIRVTVNDRLGTKAVIPCMPSDNIGDFKKLVAAMIGRKPHEIMLKRQSERPFKDMLTLEDYGVSNGVQLDLELDTGD